MAQERWARARDLFEHARSLDSSERERYLHEMCPDNESLRLQVENLVQNDRRAGSFLEHPPAVQDSASMSTADPCVFTKDEIVLGRFRIVRFLGRGGMGEVYEVEDRELGQRYALKTVCRDLSWNQNALVRLKQEVLSARKVTNENVCRVHDFFSVPEMTPEGRNVAAFLTMELISGETLSDAIRRKGPLPFDQAVVIAEQLCSALEAAHKQGVIHRDFKSGNVMLTTGTQGAVRAVVTDFGLAKIQDEEHRSLGLTKSGAVVGTPAYMPPEQYAGGPITAAADIYALGVVLHEMITGLRPPEAERAGIHPDPRWAAVICKCLKTNASERFAKVQDIVPALRPGPLTELATQTIILRHRRWRARTILAVIALLLGLAIFVVATQVNFPSKTLTNDPEGYASYLKANELFKYRRVADQAELHNVIQQYDDAIRRDPNFAAAIARRAYAYLWMSRTHKSDKGSWRERADFEIKRAEKINPKLFEVHLMKGSILTDEAQYAKARLELEAALRISPKSDEAYKKLSTLNLRSGEYLKALDAAQMAVKIGPRFFDNHLSVGFAAMQLCRLTDAEAAYKKVTELVPERPEGWNGLGSVLLMEGEFARSIDAYNKAISKGPPAATPLANIAVAYFYLGEYEQAIPSATKAVDLNPKDYTFRGNLADYYRAVGDNDKASEYYESAISLAHEALGHDENDFDAMISLALFYARTGRYDSAREELRSAILHGGDHPAPEFAYSAAIIYTLLKQPDAALNQLRYALTSCTQSVKMALNEPDLAPLRATQPFQQIIQEHAHK